MANGIQVTLMYFANGTRCDVTCYRHYSSGVFVGVTLGPA
jgi:hypothetical protein